MFSTSILISIVFVAINVFLFRFNKPTKYQSVPGPNLHFGTRLLMFIQLHFFYTVPEFTEFWCKRYGDTVGVWMNGGYTIITCDAEFAQSILAGNNSKNFISRMGHDDGLKEIGMYKRGIIWNNDVSKWTFQRRIFQNGLTSEVRQKVSIVAEEKTRQEVHYIKTSARDNVIPKIDLLNVLRHITLAVTLDVTLGTHLSRESSQYLIDCIVGYFKAWEFFLLKPYYIWYLFPLHLSRHRKAVLKLQEEISRLIPTLNPQATPFLSNLYKRDSITLTPEEIHQCILEMILAGTDTSSVSLYYAVLLLIENKNIQHQLLNSLEDDSFLESVLRESMRMMPVGPVIIRKALDNCNIFGIDMEAGTNIVINIARMNRHPKWFSDPLKFNPQRFQDNQKLVNISAPMGLGPKSCVGQHFAMVEMKPILCELLSALVFTRKDGAKPFIEIKTKWDIALQPVVNEKLFAFPRKNIILVGAHSVGKTTLSQLIKERTNAIMITETARTVMKELGMNAKLIETDPKKSLELQAAIIKAQCKKEEQMKREFAVQDRCSLDALIYAMTFCEEGWKELLDMPETKQCIDRYRQNDKYIIFLIEPNVACLKSDGTRIMPPSYEEWKAFSERYKKIMDELDIKYHILEDLDLNIRFSKVINTLFKM